MFLTFLRRGVPAQPIYNGYCHATEKYGILPRVVSYGNKISSSLIVMLIALIVSIIR